MDDLIAQYKALMELDCKRQQAKACGSKEDLEKAERAYAIAYRAFYDAVNNFISEQDPEYHNHKGSTLTGLTFAYDRDDEIAKERVGEADSQGGSRQEMQSLLLTEGRGLNSAPQPQPQETSPQLQPQPQPSPAPEHGPHVGVDLDLGLGLGFGHHGHHDHDKRRDNKETDKHKSKDDLRKI